MNLLEVEGDYFRADQIQAITSEDCDLQVWLIGQQEPVLFDYNKPADATAAKVAAVIRWQQLI